MTARIRKITTTARIRQAPGWWPSLVQVVCDDCGYVGAVHDLNTTRNAEILVKIEREAHRCHEDDDACAICGNARAYCTCAFRGPYPTEAGAR